MVIKNFSELTKQVQKKIDNSLNKEVFKTIQKVEQEEITATVYDVYEPTVYQRRRKNGGMEDIKNIQKKQEAKNGILEVVNVTKPNPQARDGATTNKDLPYLIEHGESYIGNNHYDYPAYPYASARPFTKNTIIELNQDKAHLEALKSGLERNGLRVL